MGLLGLFHRFVPAVLVVLYTSFGDIWAYSSFQALGFLWVFYICFVDVLKGVLDLLHGFVFHFLLLFMPGLFILLVYSW